jgi:hypothetical protein
MTEIIHRGSPSSPRSRQIVRPLAAQSLRVFLPSRGAPISSERDFSDVVIESVEAVNPLPHTTRARAARRCALLPCTRPDPAIAVPGRCFPFSRARCFCLAPQVYRTRDWLQLLGQRIEFEVPQPWRARDSRSRHLQNSAAQQNVRSIGKSLNARRQQKVIVNATILRSTVNSDGSFAFRTQCHSALGSSSTLTQFPVSRGSLARQSHCTSCSWTTMGGPRAELS